MIAKRWPWRARKAWSRVRRQSTGPDPGAGRARQADCGCPPPVFGRTPSATQMHLGHGRYGSARRACRAGRRRRRSAGSSDRRRRPPHRRVRGYGLALRSARCRVRCRRAPSPRRNRANSRRRDRARPPFGCGPTATCGSGTSRLALACAWPERFGGGDVGLGVGEIGDAADVVDVEVRDHDVADVVAAEAEPFQLTHGGFVMVEYRPDEPPHRPDAPGGVVAVTRAEAAVDEDQAVLRLRHQHVADRGWTPGRMHGSAVEVVNLHTCSSTRVMSPRRQLACVGVAVRWSRSRTRTRRHSW